MAARGAVGFIGMLEGPAVFFRYGIAAMATTPGEQCMAFSALLQVGNLLTKLYQKSSSWTETEKCSNFTLQLSTIT